MDMFQALIEGIAHAIEGAGVAVILVGFVLATWHFLRNRQQVSTHAAYVEYRHRMGRAILLGLDFLIAGDIIKTVVVADAMGSVAVLGIVVLIRMFLALTLHVEIEGCWPWDSARRRGTSGDG